MELANHHLNDSVSPERKLALGKSSNEPWSKSSKDFDVSVREPKAVVRSFGQADTFESISATGASQHQHIFKTVSDECDLPRLGLQNGSKFNTHWRRIRSSFES